MNILARVAVVSTASLIFSSAQGISAPLHQQTSNNSTARQSQQPESAKQEKVEDKTVAVKVGDTLVDIAKSSHVTWRRIYYKNSVITDPDIIYPGQKLIIPAKDEKLAIRPLPIRPSPVAEDPGTDNSYAAQPAPSSAVTKTYETVLSPSGDIWDELANCEAGGNWSANTGNGFYGGLQFTLESWRAVGGAGLPSSASRSEQIMRAERLQDVQGWGAWPVCSVKVGLR